MSLTEDGDWTVTCPVPTCLSLAASRYSVDAEWEAGNYEPTFIISTSTWAKTEHKSTASLAEPVSHCAINKFAKLRSALRFDDNTWKNWDEISVSTNNHNLVKCMSDVISKAQKHKQTRCLFSRGKKIRDFRQFHFTIILPFLLWRLPIFL